MSDYIIMLEIVLKLGAAGRVITQRRQESFLKITFIRVFIFQIGTNPSRWRISAFRSKIKHLRNVSSNSTYSKFKHITKKTSGYIARMF